SFESFLAPVPVNAPRVRLTELRVFNEIRANERTLAEDNLISLNSNENMFSIGFEALDFHYQEEVRYEYRLEGFHEDWIESGNMDSVTYVKLPPGQYRFVVRSSTEQGLYDESQAVLNIRVEPTFWRTPIAIAIYAALLAMTVAIIVKLREGNLLKNQVRQLEEARKKVLEANRKLEFLTMNDSLTGLLNRRGFDQAIDHALTTAHRNGLMITLYMMDVDKFKPYNDNYGHVQGDEVLRCMGKALRNVFERSTDIIARYGGEEFAVVFIGDNPGASVTLANDMILAVEQLGIIHEYSTVSNLLTLSMGSATIRATSDVTVTGLVNQADQALYAAKTAGRNRVCYTGIIPELPETMKNNIPPLINNSEVQI
ncbi:MAG: GGDEF domain-containing protein, partial [Spirochaetaceae bacterium]|nr:GGDEF domain-containing protein [Spirochaetaceae bacterium]